MFGIFGKSERVGCTHDKNFVGGIPRIALGGSYWRSGRWIRVTRGWRIEQAGCVSIVVIVIVYGAMDVHVTADHLDLLVIYLLMGARKCADHRTPCFALVPHDGPDTLAVTYLPMVGKCVTPPPSP